MESKRLFRLLTAALSVIGLSMAVLGIIRETLVGIALGVIAAVVGILLYVLEQQTTIEPDLENMDLSTIPIRMITIISLFIFISYLLSTSTSTNLSALVIFPSSILLTTSGALLGGILGVVHLPLLKFEYYSRNTERISNTLPFGIFAGLVIFFPPTCLPYALSYLICTLLTIGHRPPNNSRQN